MREIKIEVPENILSDADRSGLAFGELFMEALHRGVRRSAYFETLKSIQKRWMDCGDNGPDATVVVTCGSREFKFMCDFRDKSGIFYGAQIIADVEGMTIVEAMLTLVAEGLASMKLGGRQ